MNWEDDMLNMKGFGISTFIMALMFSAIASFAAAQSATVTYVNLNNLQNPGQPINFTQPQSSVIWNVSAVFSGGKSTISANITNTSISYTQANGKVIKAAYNLLVNGSTNSGSVFYTVNTSVPTPVMQLSSLITSGTVLGVRFQSATPAPACPTNITGKQLYTEWDYYITVQATYYGSQQNVVVGRVCIYMQQIGTAYQFVAVASPVPSSNLTLSANNKAEVLNLNYATSTSATSHDGLVTVSWNGAQVVPVNGAPQASQYVALNSSSANWSVQNETTYNKWYMQYNSFTLQNIPSQRLSYSPTSIATLYASCNKIPGSTNITNSSVVQSLECMNNTAQIYYSLNNQLGLELFKSSRNISGYGTAVARLNGNLGFTINIPSQFVEQPQFNFLLNASFFGFIAPAGIPRIIWANTTAININGVGALNVQIANVGTATSTFMVAINDCPGISTQPGISYQVAQGQIGTFSTAITATNANLTLNEQCIVNVTSSSGQSMSQAILVRTRTPNQYLHSAFDWLEANFCANPLTKDQVICVGASV